MKKMFKLLCIVLLFLANYTAQARKYHFAANGNDSYSPAQALNPATPWLSLVKMEQMSRTAGVFLPGDTIAFKRGDVFANGYTNFASMQWRNIPGSTYWIAPSGTPNAPIVITNYGDPNLPLPNLLWPQATYPVSSWCCTRPSRHVLCFTGVSNIIIEGLQSNEFRQPVNKSLPGYTGGWIIGEWTKSKIVNGDTIQGANDPNNRPLMVTNFKVRNCYWNNTQYGFSQISAINSEFSYNTMTNLRSTADTAGVNDVLACAFEALSGFYVNIHHNYIKGAWGKSGRISSTKGLGGVGFDIFNLKHSRIAYNTVIDCSGMFEIGNLDALDSTSGAQYDTIAFNKVINTSNMGYMHGSSGSFIGTNHHISIWNNVLISNNKDRQNGWGFGADIYGDGQGWRPGTADAWWFCRNPYSTFNPPNEPLKPTTTTTSGSNIVTVSSASGISLGTVAFINNDDLLGTAYQTVTVTAINGNQLTLSVPCTRSTSTTRVEYYLPVSNTSWSSPQNPACANYGGGRALVQYSTDNTTFGSYIDTMLDVRNNIIYNTNGYQILYDRNRFKRSANIYYLRGSLIYPTALGGTLNFRGTKERQMSSGRLFTDTSGVYPELWDFRPVDTSYANLNGVPISGFTTDFSGASIIGVTPFIGLFKPSNAPPPPPPTPCSFGYSAWGACVNGIQTRTYTSSPVSCTGTPPVDSLQRACTVPCASFTYSAWSTCLNGVQTRTYTASPQGCVGTPPQDSLSRACVTPPTPCNITISVLAVRNASCLNRSDGYLTVGVNCGTLPITYTLTNLGSGTTLSATSNATQYTFNFLRPATYRVTVKDSNNNTSTIQVTVRSRRNRNC